MTGNKYKNIKGFSLIEVMVSVTLFAIIILSTTQIFKMVVDGQRGAIAAQNVEESLKYFSEVTGKEMRMAQKNSDNFCSGIPADKIFVVTPVNSTMDSLSFKNRYGECVTYQLGSDISGNQRFVIKRDSSLDFITPAKIRVDALHFIVSESAQTQPIVTINLKAHATERVQFRSDMIMQTSISSRYYK
jgi:prepilin-type N-terminal cleavage/methylation domain-containing protein